MRTLLASLLLSSTLFAALIGVGQTVPLFEAKDHEGKTFKLADRKGKWTVIFFYPKAGTPGCTKQACAFRDSISKIKELNAEVYGISADSVEDLAKFHKEHKLKFALLSDADLKIIKLFDVKMMGVDMARRWTYILDPELVIRSIDTKVDPVMDPARVAERLTGLQRFK